VFQRLMQAGGSTLPATPWARAGQVVAWTARVGLAMLAVAGLADGNRTALALGVVFIPLSLLVSRIAPPVLDACLAVVLLAHGWGSLLGQADTRAWGPGMHAVTPFLVALILALGAADGRLVGRALPPRAALGTALVGSLVVIVAWELLEAFLTRLPGIHIETELDDTAADLALGAAAAAAGVGLAAALLSRRRPAAVRAEPAPPTAARRSSAAARSAGRPPPA
jgi:hypothetical protein